MSVKTISKDELRRMEGSEGLIIQGCGGSLDEWVDGINDMLTEDGILLDGTRFHDCSTFEHKSAFCVELVGTRCSCVLLFRQTLCGQQT